MKKLALLSFIGIFSLSFAMEKATIKKKNSDKKTNAPSYGLLWEQQQASIVKRVNGKIEHEKRYRELHTPGFPLYTPLKKAGIVATIVCYIDPPDKKLSLLEILDGKNLSLLNQTNIEGQMILNQEQINNIRNGNSNIFKNWLFKLSKERNKIIQFDKHGKKTGSSREFEKFKLGLPLFIKYPPESKNTHEGVVMVIGSSYKLKEFILFILAGETLEILKTAEIIPPDMHLREIELSCKKENL